MSATPTIRQPKDVPDLMAQVYERANRLYGITQTDVAAHFGKSQQAVSAWLHGTRHPNAWELVEFMRLCRAPRRLYLALREIHQPDGPQGETTSDVRLPYALTALAETAIA